jgi:hypothetical protein
VPPNPTDNSNLELVGDVKFNFNNVFCVFRTPKSYPGLTELEKKNFLKYRFASKTEEPTSAYCVQSATAFDRWECLMIYASGLPNYKYNVNFSYNSNGDSGFHNLPINPLNNTFKSRSLK